MTTTENNAPARSYPRFGAEIMTRPVRVVDLTREIFEGMPMWFGHQKTFINTNQTHDQFKATYNTHLCLDLRSVNYPDYITPADLEAALSASGQEIRKGDTVILYTGYGDATYPNLAYTEKHTGLNRAAALWLAEQGVVNIAVDNVAIDHADDADFSGHHVCGEYGIVNTEGLANLHQVVSQRFLYFGLPLFIRNGTGSPIRAVAVFQD